MSMIVTVIGVLIGFPLISIVALLAYLGFCQLRNWYMYHKSGCNAPAAPERPFIGSFTLEEPHINELRLLKELGPICYSTFLHHPVIHVSDPELCQMVLSKWNFPKSYLYKSFSDLWGPNVVTLQHGTDGVWKNHRSIVNPAFKFSSLRAMHDIFSTHAISFTKRLLEHSNKGTFDFVPEMANLTLDIISSAGFNHDLGAFKSIGASKTFLKSLQTIVSLCVNPLILFSNAGHLLRFMYRADEKIVNDTIYQIIDQRIEEKQTGKRNSNRCHDILDNLIESDENGFRLTREEIRNELFIFFFAGHETSSNILGWTLYELCKNPEVEEKLMSEIESVMGPFKGGQIIAPTTDQLDQFTYMNLVLNEILRLYPPVLSVSRGIPETFEYKGFIFPKGFLVACSMFNAQRNPALWSEPDKFNPERFLVEAENASPTFFPFSAGSRICVGKNFFYHEARIILATVLRVIHFSLDSNRESGKMTSISGFLKPEHIWTQVTPRLQS